MFPNAKDDKDLESLKEKEKARRHAVVLQERLEEFVDETTKFIRPCQYKIEGGEVSADSVVRGQFDRIVDFEKRLFERDDARLHNHVTKRNSHLRSHMATDVTLQLAVDVLKGLHVLKRIDGEWQLTEDASPELAARIMTHFETMQDTRSYAYVDTEAEPKPPPFQLDDDDVHMDNAAAPPKLPRFECSWALPSGAFQDAKDHFGKEGYLATPRYEANGPPSFAPPRLDTKTCLVTRRKMMCEVPSSRVIEASLDTVKRAVACEQVLFRSKLAMQIAVLDTEQQKLAMAALPEEEPSCPGLKDSLKKILAWPRGAEAATVKASANPSQGPTSGPGTIVDYCRHVVWQAIERTHGKRFMLAKWNQSSYGNACKEFKIEGQMAKRFFYKPSSELDEVKAFGADGGLWKSLFVPATCEAAGLGHVCTRWTLPQDKKSKDTTRRGEKYIVGVAKKLVRDDDEANADLKLQLLEFTNIDDTDVYGVICGKNGPGWKDLDFCDGAFDGITGEPKTCSRKCCNRHLLDDIEEQSFPLDDYRKLVKHIKEKIFFIGLSAEQHSPRAKAKKRGLDSDEDETKDDLDPHPTELPRPLTEDDSQVTTLSVPLSPTARRQSTEAPVPPQRRRGWQGGVAAPAPSPSPRARERGGCTLGLGLFGRGAQNA